MGSRFQSGMKKDAAVIQARSQDQPSREEIGLKWIEPAEEDDHAQPAPADEHEPASAGWREVIWFVQS